MVKVLDYFIAAILNPEKDSIQTYFIFLAIMISLTVLVAVAIIALCIVIAWIKKQWQLRRRTMNIEKIICEAYGLERLGQAEEVSV